MTTANELNPSTKSRLTFGAKWGVTLIKLINVDIEVIGAVQQLTNGILNAPCVIAQNCTPARLFAVLLVARVADIPCFFNGAEDSAELDTLAVVKKLVKNTLRDGEGLGPRFVPGDSAVFTLADPDYAGGGLAWVVCPRGEASKYVNQGAGDKKVIVGGSEIICCSLNQLVPTTVVNILTQCGF